MQDLQAHHKLVRERLGRLARLVSDARRQKFFQENLDVNEFEVSYYALCDFLLEPGTPPVSGAVLDEIESLHTLMKIQDDCIKKLRQKAAAS
jgi:hypothetical protein